MKMLAAQPWDANAANSLHKAAQFFTSLESYWTQRLVVRALLPTCEYHSRWPADGLACSALECLTRHFLPQYVFHIQGMGCCVSLCLLPS